MNILKMNFDRPEHHSFRGPSRKQTRYSRMDRRKRSRTSRDTDGISSKHEERSTESEREVEIDEVENEDSKSIDLSVKDDEEYTSIFDQEYKGIQGSIGLEEEERMASEEWDSASFNVGTDEGGFVAGLFPHEKICRDGDVPIDQLLSSLFCGIRSSRVEKAMFFSFVSTDS